MTHDANGPAAPAETRFLLTHPAFPSQCAAWAHGPLGLETIALPADSAGATAALAPLRAAGCRFVLESELFLRFSSELPEERRRALSVLCDKAAFRRTIQQAEDVLAVRSLPVRREELLESLTWEEVRRELDPAQHGVVLKPLRGFQSDLVSICRTADDWERARARVASPPPGISAVTDTATFIAESYVPGDELAIDVYFDDDGRPVICGIYLHPFRDELDARDIVYRTSPSIVRRYRARFERALAAWNQTLGLRDFPVHAEVRVTPEGEVFPIELNPLRFGLLTIDITLYAFGVNPYHHYFERTAPDWARFEGADERATGLIVAPMPEGDRQGVEVDYKGFERDLRERGLEVQNLERLPYREIPFYAAAYVSGRAEAMDGYLSEDFGRWVRPVSR